MSSVSKNASGEGSSDGSDGGKDSCKRGPSKEDELDLAKAEMNQVQEENARLKMMIKKIDKEYKSLQMRFRDIDQQGAKKSSNSASIIESTAEEPELISLRLGRCPSELKKDENTGSSSKTRESEEFTDSLKLGLDCGFGRTKSDTIEVKSASPENSRQETRKDEQGDASKDSKTSRSEEEELAHQSSVKRARVSVRARCDTPTMNDGCQWRKYGQKISKGNPCPRAYYRCTVAPLCPVRKQVQRCAQDMSILITTYEGTHNHQLSVTATAMASTTSAAASMLLSGSSITQPGLGSSATTSQAANLHGLNVNPLNNTRSKPFYLPNPPSPSPAYPTITLDLTTSGPSSHFNMFSSNFQSNPTFPSQNLNFSSSETTTMPAIWGSGYLNYGTLPNESKSNPLGRPSQEHFYQPYIEKTYQVASQQPLAETLTKALTSDPSFRSVIEAAISSMVGASKVTQGDLTQPRKEL